MALSTCVNQEVHGEFDHDNPSRQIQAHRFTLTSMTSILGLIFAALVSCSCTKSLAQNVAIPASNGVFLTSLFQPVYPPLARATHITGDVVLMVGIRQDGLVESVMVVSGHPLLRQAALASARKSGFECRKCSEPVTAYRLVYTFQIEGKCECEPAENNSNNEEKGQTSPHVSEADHRVTVVGLVLCTCDPGPTRKIRTLKCLYLWKCTTQ